VSCSGRVRGSERACRHSRALHGLYSQDEGARFQPVPNGHEAAVL